MRGMPVPRYSLLSARPAPSPPPFLLQACLPKENRRRPVPPPLSPGEFRPGGDQSAGECPGEDGLPHRPGLRACRSEPGLDPDGKGERAAGGRRPARSGAGISTRARKGRSPASPVYLAGGSADVGIERGEGRFPEAPGRRTGIPTLQQCMPFAPPHPTS